MRASVLLPFFTLFLCLPVRAGEQSATAAGWIKHPNPVLGGDLGTCFDISVLKEGDTYRMWFSWRPKKSIALVESKDGVQWSKPVIVLGPNEKTDWENDLEPPRRHQERRPLPDVVHWAGKGKVVDRICRQPGREDVATNE